MNSKEGLVQNKCGKTHLELIAFTLSLMSFGEKRECGESFLEPLLLFLGETGVSDVFSNLSSYPGFLQVSTVKLNLLSPAPSHLMILVPIHSVGAHSRPWPISSKSCGYHDPRLLQHAQSGS